MAAKRKTNKTDTSGKAVKSNNKKRASNKSQSIDTSSRSSNKVSFTKKELKVKKGTYYKFVGILIILGLLYLGRSLIVVAMVNGYPLTRISVVKELEKSSGKQALDSLITKQLILQEAKKSGIVVSEGDIDEKIESTRQAVEQQGYTLEDALSIQGQTIEDLKENLMYQVYIERLLVNEINVTDEEIKEYYDSNKSLIGETRSFDDAKEDMRQQLLNQQIATKYQTWITDLKENSQIRYIYEY